jgi:hypothetical protein
MIGALSNFAVANPKHAFFGFVLAVLMFGQAFAFDRFLNNRPGGAKNRR